MLLVIAERRLAFVTYIWVVGWCCQHYADLPNMIVRRRHFYGLGRKMVRRYVSDRSRRKDQRSGITNSVLRLLNYAIARIGHLGPVLGSLALYASIQQIRDKVLFGRARGRPCHMSADPQSHESPRTTSVSDNQSIGLRQADNTHKR